MGHNMCVVCVIENSLKTGLYCWWQSFGEMAYRNVKILDRIAMGPQRVGY